MDKEKPSEENTESQGDLKDRETISETETSVDDKEKPVEEENLEKKEEINAESDDSVNKINADKQNSPNNELTNSENPELLGEANVSEPEQSRESASQTETSKVESKKASEDNVQEKPVEKTPIIPKSKEGKEGSWTPMIIVMGISFVIAFAWDKMDFIKNSVHAVLDPSAGALLNWNLTIGMLLIVLVIGVVTTLIQKYATDQETLKDLKKQQKEIHKKSQEFKHDPKKAMEIQKEVMPLTMKMMKLNGRGIMFTGIPFILFFRWFTDYFAIIPDFKFFGFLSWFWFYLIFTMVLSMILRKVLKIV